MSYPVMRRSPRINVSVDADIIETSARKDSSHCMIADAVKAAVPNAAYISVDLATIRFTDVNAGVRYIYLTPRPAQAALLDFDNGDKPAPFTIQLRGAHVVPAGTARKARASLSSTAGNSLPEKHGGTPPPMGALQGGATPPKDDKRTKNPGGGVGNRTGRRREFGLRAIIR